MAINIYNKKTGKWEKNSSTLASGIKVIDVPGNFEDPSKNVEQCLNEIKENIAKVKEDIKYIYENGTIGGGGGGGGGGGSAFPKITLDGDSSIKCTTDEIINIYYFFQSPNYGRGKAYYILNNGEAEIVEVNQGKVRRSIGPLNSGTHRLQIYVEDSAGLQSNYLTIDIKAGTLEIVSTFDPTNNDKDFAVNDPINIEYQLNAINQSDPITVKYTKDGVVTEEVKPTGRHTWVTGGFTKTGGHNLKLEARNSTETSNILNYNILVVDSRSLYITSDYNITEIDYGKNITIDYRLSMEGENSFLVEHYINDRLVDTINDAGKTNFWQVGKLQPGEYRFRILAKTKGENTHTAELNFTTTVTANNFIPFWTITDMLLASFEANGKSNGSTNKNVWEDKSGNNTKCTLYNFNYSTNGWLQHDYFNDKTTALTFNGKAYAVIDLNPFGTEYPEGLTIDILFKIENVGNIDSKVLDCKRKDAPYTGVYAGIEKTSIRTRDEEADVKYPEREFIRLTYVVDKRNKLLKTFSNGTISSLRILRATDTILTNGKKIILGAEELLDGTIANYSNSAIKSIHVYKKSLSDLEVLQNYIADIDNIDEQLRIRELNCLKVENGEIIKHNELSVPTLTLIGDISKMDNMIPALMEVNYRDPNDPSKTFSGKTGYVKWQGTSSLQYPVKNYTIDLKDGGTDFMFAPKDDWVEESRFTLKADFMESSHANNIGIATMYEDIIKKYLINPPKTFESGIPAPKPNIANTKPKTRNAINGFPIKLIIQTPKETMDMGVYNFNLDRYAHRNYGLYGENKAVSYEIGVNSKNGAGAFADDSWDSIKREFDYRYHNAGGEEDVTVPATDSGSLQGDRWLEKGKHVELEELVSWVKNTSGELFEAQFFEHFDVHYTLIYYLVVYTLGIIDNLGKNMVLTTWGRDEVSGNTIWYPQLYDLDSALGLDNSGRMRYEPDVDMASGHFNTSDSVLWTKINESRVLKECINTIYRHIRFELGLLNADNFMKYYNTGVIQKVGSRFYNEDINAKYTDKNGSHDSQYLYMCNGSRIEQTKRWLEERFIYMDSIFGSLDNSKSIIVRANKSVGQKTIRIKTYSPMWITVSFSDAVGNQFKKYVSRNEWTDFTGTISSDTDNNIHITGAKNLMYVDGISQLNVSSLLIGEAERLVELDVSGSIFLEGVYLGNNRMLQKLKLNNCPKLGAKTVDNTVDISNCINIKHVDISNTKLTTLVLSSQGGSLEYLNCSNTKLTSFTITNQEYLASFDITSCPDLSYIYVTNCSALQNLDCSNGNLIEFNVKNCDLLNTINASKNPRLETSDFSGSANLRTLYMQDCTSLRDLNVSNTNLLNLNITNCLNLVTLNLNATKINTLNLTTLSKLKNLYLKNTTGLFQVMLPSVSIIELLELNNSNLETLDLNSQITLKHLDLTSSRITGIDFSRLVNLEFLSLINSNITNLDLSKTLKLNSLRLANKGEANANIILLDLSNSLIRELNLKNGDYLTCTNLKILKVDNTSNLEVLSVNPGLASVSIKNSKITNTVWEFKPVFPMPLLSENNMANYTRVTLNGDFLSEEDILALKAGTLMLLDDTYIEVFDGILAGNIFFLDSTTTVLPDEGFALKYIFPDPLVAEHIRVLLGKNSVEDIATKQDLNAITWIGKSYSFVAPDSYKGYFDNLNIKTFKGINYLTNLNYINLAGCLFKGSLQFRHQNIDKLDFSFADMPNLTSVTFENQMSGLRTISYAFSNCRNLTSIILPNAVNLENANYAFKNCIKITDVITNNVNNTLKYMNGTFSGCLALRNLKVQTKIDSLLEFVNIFENCYIENVSFTNNETITKTSEITLFEELIKVSKKMDLSNLVNLAEIDSPDGENRVVEEFNLNNTKVNFLDITGAYIVEPPIYVETYKYGF
ncbi:CotH kinase family protein [Cetobacterium sp.]|uniref:CotH kinase family protein n=1 Tax=Cetobacterium sp. TaxID=2071632 RepID=UPI003F3D7932